MRFHLLIGFCAFSMCGPGFSQELEWINSFGSIGKGGDQGNFELTADGDGYLFTAGNMGPNGIVMGSFSLEPEGDGDLVFAKLDANGNVIWAATAPNHCGPYDLSTVWHTAYDGPTQQFFACGVHRGSTEFGDMMLNSSCFAVANVFLASYNSDGACNWVRGSEGNEVRPYAMLVDQNSNIHVFGVNSLGSAEFDGGATLTVEAGVYVVHYDSDGSLLGLERIMPVGSGFGGVLDAALVDDEWLICGEYVTNDSLYGVGLPSTQGSTGAFVARVDGEGGVQWIRTVDSNVGVTFAGCVGLPSGRSVMYGFSDGSSYFPNDTVTIPEAERSGIVASYTADGTLDWVFPVRSPLMLAMTDIVFAPDTTIMIYGRSKGTLEFGSATVTTDASQDAFIARLDTAGNILGITHFGRVRNMGSGSILATDDGVYVSGLHDSTLTYQAANVPTGTWGETRSYIAKFDNVVGFTGERSYDEDNQLTIYANPNNGLCTIDLPDALRPSNDLFLSVYDNTGQLVQRAPLQFTDGGIRLDVRAQAKGLYHVELGDGRQRYTGTIVFE